METPDDWLPAELRGRPLTRPFHETLTAVERQALRDGDAERSQDELLRRDPYAE